MTMARGGRAIDCSKCGGELDRERVLAAAETGVKRRAGRANETENRCRALRGADATTGSLGMSEGRNQKEGCEEQDAL